MHVPIQQPRHDVTTIRFNDLGRFTNGVGAILTYISDPLSFYRDIRLWDDFPGLHTHPAAISNHQVSWCSPHGDIHEGFGYR
jgi:hypothetical protein